MFSSAYRIFPSPAALRVVAVRGGGATSRTTNTLLRALHSQSHHTTYIPLDDKTEKKRKIPKNSPMPITVLSGFLGAGKTTFLNHLLQNNAGLKVGLVVNDVASVNVDAKQIRSLTSSPADGSSSSSSTAAKIDTMELHNGCVCCSLAEDLLASISKLVSLAELKGERYDHILVECSGVAEPRNIRDVFQQAQDYKMEIMKKLRLDTLVTLVDVKTFYSLFGTDQTLAQHRELAFAATKAPQREQDQEDAGSSELQGERERGEDEGNAMRKVTDLLLEQVECADVVLLNKCDLAASQREIDVVESVVRAVNPHAAVLACTRGRVPDALRLLGSGGGRGAANWALLDEHHNLVRAADRETEEREALEKEKKEKENESHHATSAQARFGISSFVYRRRMPFHPLRFSSLLQSLGTLSVDGIANLAPPPASPSHHSDNGAESKEEDKEKEKDLQAARQALLRSKGFVWLATSQAAAYFLSHAGQCLEISIMGRWWADIDRQQWPEGLQSEIESDFSGADGDRRQELVFIGQFDEQGGKSKAALEDALDACLLTDDELRDYHRVAEKGGDLALQEHFVPDWPK